MPAESPRILELRRRVQSDPSSIAFAQLAEEYRRAGSYEEAIKCCRTGLARHPGYLSARVTLGRALTELGSLDDAAREFELVLRSAPENLAAIRGMAEIQQRRGNLEQALDYYKRALMLARHDPDLEETVSAIRRELGMVTKPPESGLGFAEAQTQLLTAALRVNPPTAVPAAAALSADAPPAALASEPVAAAAPAPENQPTVLLPVVPQPRSDRADFDAMLSTLGAADRPAPPRIEMLLSEPPIQSPRPDVVLPELPAEPDSQDPFAALERQLRAFDGGGPPERVAPAPAVAPPPPPQSSTREVAVLDELEQWLATLHAERRRQN